MFAALGLGGARQADRQKSRKHHRECAHLFPPLLNQCETEKILLGIQSPARSIDGVAGEVNLILIA
jgi:hypothetical protein